MQKNDDLLERVSSELNLNEDNILENSNLNGLEELPDAISQEESLDAKKRERERAKLQRERERDARRREVERNKRARADASLKKKAQAKSREFLPWTNPDCQLYKKNISNKYTVSVPYNKGAYQVISEEDVKHIGK